MAESGAQKVRRNVLFLMVDCMRADTLWDRQRYPYVPNLEKLMARSTSFTEMITAATTTTPSVATLLTGRYPAEHGIRSLLGYKLQPDVKTLPEILREHGYHTIAEVTGPLFPVTGLDRGYDFYHRRERHWYLDTGWGSKIVATLGGNRLQEPWFMFLHLWELHWPRKAKGEFASPKYGKQLYQRSVAYLDSQLPRILGLDRPGEHDRGADRATTARASPGRSTIRAPGSSSPSVPATSSPGGCPPPPRSASSRSARRRYSSRRTSRRSRGTPSCASTIT